MTVNDEAVAEESKEAEYLSVGEGCTEFRDGIQQKIHIKLKQKKNSQRRREKSV